MDSAPSPESIQAAMAQRRDAALFALAARVPRQVLGSRLAAAAPLRYVRAAGESWSTLDSVKAGLQCLSTR